MNLGAPAAWMPSLINHCKITLSTQLSKQSPIQYTQCSLFELAKPLKLRNGASNHGESDGVLLQWFDTFLEAASCSDGNSHNLSSSKNNFRKYTALRKTGFKPNAPTYSTYKSHVHALLRNEWRNMWRHSGICKKKNNQTLAVMYNPHGSCQRRSSF